MFCLNTNYTNRTNYSSLVRIRVIRDIRVRLHHSDYYVLNTNYTNRTNYSSLVRIRVIRDIRVRLLHSVLLCFEHELHESHEL